MKIPTQFIITAVFGASLMASPVLSSAEGEQSSHIGQTVMTKDQWISALEPKPAYKTRGIRFAQAAQQEVPKVAPTAIAMDVKFAYDSAQLSEAAIAQLKPLGEALNAEQLKDFQFRIDGHTDATGGEDYNMDLSKRRAIAVGMFLYQNYGVDIARLVVSGKGEAELFDAQNPAAGVNRRVEIQTIVN